MNDLFSLIKRNILIFIRDKTAVFFSMLSVIILLGLYFLFIGRSYTQGLPEEFVSDELKTFLSVGVIMGGLLVINTVSLSLGVMGNIINDIEKRKLDGFLVTPVQRYKVIVSYHISSIIVTSILTLFMWFITIIYTKVFSGYWFSFDAIIKTSLLIIFYTIISATLMIFLTTLLKSVNAFGTLSGVLGTVIGFVSGIYMPLSVLGKEMTLVASTVPFTHMTIILKKILLKDPYANLPDFIVEQIEVGYGTTEIGFLGLDVGLFWLMIASSLVGIIMLVFAYKNLEKRM
jgi:multidrug/hemolysin transport system permease protein